MPRGDRTGPRSEGPMTGRGFGSCTGSDRAGYNSGNQGSGRGRGFFSSRGSGQQLGNRRANANRSRFNDVDNSSNNLTLWEEIKQMISGLTKRIENLERKDNR